MTYINDRTKRKKMLLCVFNQIFASKKETTDTYSSTLRELNKHNPEKMYSFMKYYLNAFNNALEADIEDHQSVALLEAKQRLR